MRAFPYISEPAGCERTCAGLVLCSRVYLVLLLQEWFLNTAKEHPSSSAHWNFSSGKVFLHTLGWSSCFLLEEGREEGINRFFFFKCQKWRREHFCDVGMFFPKSESELGEILCNFHPSLSEMTTDCRWLQPPKIPQGLLWDVRDSNTSLHIIPEKWEIELKQFLAHSSLLFLLFFFPSQLRYKETFENTKGKYHTVKDALDIVYHRKVTDDISSVCTTS